ncbi:MAG: FecR domain-containing protein [Candidatus Omnitrophica bacterium]|nr:FecR domain-containing protein [Candidatus Omnitrophota bacterium]
MFKKIALVLVLCSVLTFPALCDNGNKDEVLVPIKVQVRELNGTAKVKRAQSREWTPLALNMALNENDVIRSVAKSQVTLVLESKRESSIIDVYGNSEVAFLRLERAKLTGEERIALSVSFGRIYIRSAKLEGQSTFKVVTPTSVVSVKGEAKFEVGVSALD